MSRVDSPIWWGGTQSQGGNGNEPAANPASMESQYAIQQELGHGTYGTVYRATRRSDREQFAIKELPKRRIKNLQGVLMEARATVRIVAVGSLLMAVAGENYADARTPKCAQAG